MRRWLLIFLMCVFPFQSVLATAMQYCAHEKSKQTTHLGHHQHQHGDKADTGDRNAKADPDCAHWLSVTVTPAAAIEVLPQAARSKPLQRAPSFRSASPEPLDPPPLSSRA